MIWRVVLVGLFLSAALPTSEAAECIPTLSHYNAISIGMTDKQVVDIVGCAGDMEVAYETATSRGMTLRWKHPNSAADLAVEFLDGLVITKWGYSLK
jgi:hypothetical protein